MPSGRSWGGRFPANEIISLLDTLWRERRLTLILVTHDSAVARRAQRIGLMRNGRLTVRQDTRA